MASSKAWATVTLWDMFSAGECGEPTIGTSRTRRNAVSPTGPAAYNPATTITGNEDMAPIDLHFWPTPNGWKITLMLEECGLPYEIKYVNLREKEQFSEAFLKISPNGRMPAIVDPDGPGGEPI